MRRVPGRPGRDGVDVVEFIARGQIKTLACYDFAPSLGNSQIFKAQDWYEKAQRFQRAVASGDGTLEQKVDAFLAELAEPSRACPASLSSTPTLRTSRSARTSPSTCRADPSDGAHAQRGVGATDHHYQKATDV